MMSDSKLCSLSYSVYLKFLAVSDTLVLIANLFTQTEKQFRLPMVANINNTLCKMSVTYQLYTMLLSPWLVIGLTLDRFVCVCLPLTRRRLCTRKKSIAVCSCMVAATILLVLPSLILTKLGNGGCNPSDELVYYLLPVRLIMSATLPCVLILLLNIVMIVRIKRSNEFRNTLIRNRQILRTTVQHAPWC
ncbi:nociceptin receptor-like [Gigantopelta aegis]|uniref:nociceptin receptor-like n=1 Tax=Gigantopelta aegis TaxID=1735272 RepID=UPI001B887EC4|nr:nociceptin receptor-like [Gigantopelta aegis]